MQAARALAKQAGLLPSAGNRALAAAAGKEKIAGKASYPIVDVLGTVIVIPVSQAYKFAMAGAGGVSLRSLLPV